MYYNNTYNYIIAYFIAKIISHMYLHVNTDNREIMIRVSLGTTFKYKK